MLFLAEGWLAVAYYRDGSRDGGLDTAFLPYGLITRVTVSLHPKSSRKAGFTVGSATARSSLAAVDAG